jgi:hypothetical protein
MSADIATVEEARTESVAEVLAQQRGEQQPLESPVSTSVIANTSPVTTIAITKRHLRHCISRNAVNTMITTNL